MKTLVVCFLLLITETLFCFGADNALFFSQHSFTFLTEENELPDNYVDDLLKDSHGYIWIATHKGLCRYDGYRVVTYDTKSAHIRLKSGFVHKLCEDAQQRLWVGTESGLDIVNLQTYTSVSPPAVLGKAAASLSDAYITSIYKDRHGRLWISTENELWCLAFGPDGNVCDWHRLEQKSISPILAITDLSDGLCVGIDNNLYLIETVAEHRLRRKPLSEQIRPFSEDWRIQCMAVDGDYLWVGTNRGLFNYHLKTFEQTRYRYSNHRPGMLSQAYITDVKVTENGRLIVATLNGLNVFDRETQTFEYIRQNNTQPQQSLNCSSINCLLTDGPNIWAGTQTGGINLLTPKSLKTVLLTCTANTLAEDHEGNIWAGVIEGGLNRFNKTNQTFTTFKFQKENPHSISNNTLTGLLIDRKNRLWAYTWGVGINLLDLNIPGNQRFERLEREDSIGLESDFTSSACEDPLDGGIWFTTTRGLHYYDTEKQRFTHVKFPEADKEFESVGIAIIDKKKRLWMPTSKGVFILDLYPFHQTPGHLNYVYLKYRLSDPKSLRQERINCVLQAHDGTIWLGSDGNGLYRLVAEQGREFVFTNYTMSDGLSDNNVLCMTEDGAGYIWMTTGYGLSCLDPSSMVFTNYTKEDGLPGNQFHRQACFYSASRDLLYFGTLNGIVSFGPTLPKNLPSPAEPPTTRISRLSIDGHVVYPPSQTDSVRQPANPAQGVILHEKGEGFSMEFSTLNYGKLNRVRYAYRLKGHDEDWIETKPGENRAQYTRLPAGKYILQVHATDEKGHWSETVTEVEVYVQPYFYKTGIFWMVVLLIAGGIGMGGYARFRQRHEASHSSPPPASGQLQTATDSQLPAVPTAILPDAPDPETGTSVPYSKDKEFLAMAYDVINQHYKDPDFGVDAFVHHLGYSKTLVNTRLQALSGSSIGQFMKNYRLDRSKELVEQPGSQASVTDLAYAVGFSDPKYFTKCFKERFGMPPSELLKRRKTVSPASDSNTDDTLPAASQSEGES